MRHAFAAALLALVTAEGCGGGGGGGGGPSVTGALKVLNGPTSTAQNAAGHLTESRDLVAATSLPDGTYRLSPSKMTLQITAVGLVPAGASGNNIQMRFHDVSCSATYDRSVSSLAILSDCSFQAPTGSFGGVALQYNTTYSVVMDDAEAGIYSDPAAPGGLTTSRPAAGPQPIAVTDQNSSFGQVTTYFAEPISIDGTSNPQLYVVFEPTHWMIATSTSGSFSAPSMSGNPPIVPSASQFGKAVLYSNIGTTMSYRWDGCDNSNCESLLFLYGDATTPASVTWQDHDICSQSGGGPVVAFNGDGTLWGTCGYLGLDSSGTLAWVSPAGFSSTSGAVTGYTGVYAMPARSNIGDTTTLQYKCTGAVPTPASGSTYSSGAPSFAPDGTVSLTLVEN